MSNVISLKGKVRKQFPVTAKLKGAATRPSRPGTLTQTDTSLRERQRRAREWQKAEQRLLRSLVGGGGGGGGKRPRPREEGDATVTVTPHRGWALPAFES